MMIQSGIDTLEVSKALQEIGFTKKQAEALPRILVDVVQDTAATKSDVAALKADIVEVKTEIADVRAEIADVRAEVADVRAEIVEVRAEITDVKVSIAQLEIKFIKYLVASQITFLIVLLTALTQIL
jgi:chromosome segregation ATPase